MAPSDSSHVIRALLQHALTVLDNQPDNELYLGDRQLNSAITDDDFALAQARSEARAWENKYFEMVEKRTAAASALNQALELAERWKYTGDRKEGPLRELLAALEVSADGRPTDAHGRPLRYAQLVEQGWGYCDGCQTWSQATPESPHECPMTHIQGPAREQR